MLFWCHLDIIDVMYKCIFYDLEVLQSSMVALYQIIHYTCLITSNKELNVFEFGILRVIKLI